MSTECQKVISAKAPAKIIFSGEHAVVYGCPALALAVNRFATTTISQQSKRGICFELLNDNTHQIVSLQELQSLKTKISKRYLKFTAGKLQIKDVITNPLHLIQYAFIYLTENLFLPVTSGLKIQVGLNLPIGGGMGASAAIILSLISALISFYGQTLSIDKYLYFSREIENLQHGRSSGLDLYVSLHGGCHLFVAGDAKKRNLPKIPFVLVNTGKTTTSTGECVESVAKHLQNSTLTTDFTQITLAMDLALQQNNLEETKRCISENNILLQKIGVVPKKVADFINTVTARGNAAKISGAGAISGNNAGIVLVAGDEEISDIITTYGYEIIPIQGESSGLCIL